MLPFLLSVALAQPSGVLIRLNTGDLKPAGSVQVALTPEGKEPVLIELKDDGANPDVKSDDGSYAGSTLIEGDRFEVKLTMGGKDYEGGEVSWEEGQYPRDLELSIVEGKLETSTTHTPASGAAPPGPTGQTGPPQAATGAAGTSTESPPGGAAGAPSGPSPSGGAPSGPTPSMTLPGRGGGSGSGLFFALGGGLLALVGIAWLWSRSRGEEGPVDLGPLRRVPSPGLWGPGSPSLSDGLHAWQSAHPAEDVGPLLQSLARDHRVLVVAPAEQALPLVGGGPVYRAPQLRAAHALNLAQALQREGGAPLCLLVLGLEDAAVKELADALPEEVGGFVLSSAETGAGLPQVRVQRQGSGWSLEHRGSTLALRASPQGLVRA